MNESEKIIKKYKELWSKIIHLIRSIIKNSDDYDESYMKIKFDLKDELPLNKTTEMYNITIVVRAVFHENNRYYPEVFLDGFLHKINDIKNHTCHFFNNVMNAIFINFNDVLLDEKLYKETYDISYKTSTGAKLLLIRYDDVIVNVNVR